LQSNIALSKTKVEYITLTEAMKKALRIRGLVGNLGLAQELSVMHFDS
jgi:hypothetical protein